MTARAFIFSALLSFLSPASAGLDCSSFAKDRVAGVAVGFEYPKTYFKLKMSKEDMEFYHSKIGSSVSNSPRSFSDQDLQGKTKQDFLKMLTDQIRGKDTVVFSYAGHGVQYKGKTWAMMLPTMPEDLLSLCGNEIKLSGSAKDISRRVSALSSPTSTQCLKVKDYLITDAELRQVFGDRKVIVFNDSCHSGGADFGPHAVSISASLADQAAEEKLAARAKGVKNGRFTHRMKLRFSECHLDINHDGTLDGTEFTSRFAFAKPGTTVQTYHSQPKSLTVSQQLADTPKTDLPSVKVMGRKPKPFRESVQQATITGTPPWLQCLQLGTTTCADSKAVTSEDGRD